MLCYAMLCYGYLCYAILCYPMLCYAMPTIPLGCEVTQEGEKFYCRDEGGGGLTLTTTHGAKV